MGYAWEHLLAPSAWQVGMVHLNPQEPDVFSSPFLVQHSHCLKLHAIRCPRKWMISCLQGSLLRELANLFSQQMSVSLQDMEAHAELSVLLELDVWLFHMREPAGCHLPSCSVHLFLASVMLWMTCGSFPLLCYAGVIPGCTAPCDS